MLQPEHVALLVTLAPGLRIGYDVDASVALEAVRRGLLVVGAAQTIEHRETVHHLYRPPPPPPSTSPAQLVEAVHPEALDVLRLIAKHRHMTEQEIAKSRFNGRVLPARGVISWLLWAGQIMPDPHGQGYVVAPVLP